MKKLEVLKLYYMRLLIVIIKNDGSRFLIHEMNHRFFSEILGKITKNERKNLLVSEISTI
jgi:hypothetical protein